MKKRVRIIALLTVIAVSLCSVLCGCGAESEDIKVKDKTTKGAVVRAEYPEVAPYPEGDIDVGLGLGGEDSEYEDQYAAWAQSRAMILAEAEKYDKTPVDGFMLRTVKEVLTSGNKGDNAVYSPVNVYIALAMLAEISDGDCRKEALSLLGYDNVEEMRENVRALWFSSYSDDGAVVEKLAASLWMNEDVSYKKDVLETLAKYYFASSFSGRCGDPDYDALLHDWLNEQTGGQLKGQVENIKMSPETVLEMLTTIYFRAKWDTKFDKARNTEEIFHGFSGDAERTFMHRTDSHGTYYAGDKFGAIKLELTNAGYMWIFLPDEGAAPEDVLDSADLAKLLTDPNGYPESKIKSLKINISMPKFDVSSKLDLVGTLRGLGLTSCFAFDTADFSPLTDADAVVTAINHCARVTADEEGVVATAFTEMAMCGAALPPDEEMDFTVDRPFVFTIADYNEVLFIGVVNDIG